MHPPNPSHPYRLYDLGEDFFVGLADLMSLGFSVHHLDYVLDPLPPDSLSGDPPPPGFERFTLSWAPLEGQNLSDELNQALLDKFPVRTITEKADEVTDTWYRTVGYILLAVSSGEV